MNDSNESKQKSYRPRGSLFFPIVLVALGIVFLLQNTHVISGDAWDTLWKLWPVILIIIGLDNLLQREGVAGPVFFCGLGVVLLLSNFGLLAWDVWGLLLRLWPVLLIAWGLDLVVGRRSAFGALVALILVIAILLGALFFVGGGASTVVQQVSWTPEDAISRLTVNLEPAVVNLRLQATTDQAALIQGKLSEQTSDGAAIQKETTISGETGIFHLSSTGAYVYYPSRQNSPEWDLTILNEYPVDLRVEMAVGQMDLDLRQLELQNLKINLAVGQTVIYLPAQTFSGQISGAVGQTILYVPQGATVRLAADTGLTSVVVAAGFRSNNDVYTLTGNSDAPVIDLNISQSLGSLIVRLY